MTYRNQKSAAPKRRQYAEYKSLSPSSGSFGKITFFPNLNPSGSFRRFTTRPNAAGISGSFGKIALHREPTPSGSFRKINSRPNVSGSFRKTSPNRNLNHNNPLATLILYVSRLRQSPSSPPSSGDLHAAGPGLIRSSKSNERTPAAVPAGFFIAAGPRAGNKNGQQ